MRLRQFLTVMATGSVLLLGACAADDVDPQNEPSTSQDTAAPRPSDAPMSQEPGPGDDTPPADGAQTLTMAEVAEHNTPESCWTAIDGVVYDLTDWVSQHPGGPANIAKLCGRDGTQMFNNQHSGDDEPHEEREQFVIGELAE